MKSYKIPNADDDLQNLHLLRRSKETIAICHDPTKIVQECVQHDGYPPDVYKKREREALQRDKCHSSR